jgi:hypothetical protein
MDGMIDIIEKTRQEMIDSVKETGYTSLKTVELSQLLDSYILQHQKNNLKRSTHRKKTLLYRNFSVI